MWDKKLTSFYSVIIIALLLLSPDFLITNFCFGVFFIQSHFFFACSSLFLFFWLNSFAVIYVRRVFAFGRKDFLGKCIFNFKPFKIVWNSFKCTFGHVIAAKETKQVMRKQKMRLTWKLHETEKKNCVYLLIFKYMKQKRQFLWCVFHFKILFAFHFLGAFS